MAALHADDSPEAATGDESILHKCRVLNEKLDLLLSTLHEEAPSSPVHSGTPRASIDEDELAETGDSVATTTTTVRTVFFSYF